MLNNTATEAVDLRILRTRKYLVQALFELMQEKAFQKISVQDIAERAMINRSTFYAHFSDKYDLFATAIEQRIRSDLERRLADAEGFTEDNLRAVILLTGEIMRKTFSDCGPTPTDDLLPLILMKFDAIIYRVILSWTKTVHQKLGDAQSPETLAKVCTGAIFGSVHIWYHEGREITIEQLADQILPLLMSGIGDYVISGQN